MGSRMVRSWGDRLRIVHEARRLLGHNGENWIKGTMRGQRVGSSELFQKLPGIARDGALPITKADCWCVLGSFDQACLNLNYRLPPPKEWSKWGEELGMILMTFDKEQNALGVGWAVFNDRPEHAWAHIDGRLEEFEGRLSKAARKERG